MVDTNDMPLRAQYNQRKQQNNKKQITLWKPKEHCVQFAVVMYEQKQKKRGERAKGAADTAVEAPNWHFCPPFLNLKSF